MTTEAPLFERTQAPRTKGSGPGRFRSVVEKDFERGLRVILGLFDPRAAFDTSSPFL